MHQHPTGRKRILGAALVVATLTLAAACGGGDDEAPAASSPATSEGDVSLQLVTFKPETVTIQPGASVTWTQKDPGFHTVTSGTVEQGGAGVTTAPDGRFDSGELATDKTFQFTFDQPGTYPYFCSIHPATMRGEVRVG